MDITAEIVKELIGPKKPKVAEIELTLFENCDVNCTFCGHEKKATVGMSLNEMLSKIPIISKFLDSIDEDISLVNLHLVGGELLQDRLITDGYFSHYERLIEAYIILCQQRNITPRVLLVTNMLTSKTQEVKAWLEKMNKELFIRLIASYDLYGRPITKKYLENIEELKPFIANINVVVTKDAIKKLKEGDLTFDYLYQNFTIFMDDFLPDNWTQHMIPSDEEYYEYLRLVATRYPKLLPFGEALTKIRKSQLNEIQFTTFNKCNILPNNLVTNYLWDRHLPENFEGTVNYQDNSNMLYRFLQENECLSCEHFQACPLRCPVSWSWKNRERSSGCVNKRFFDSFLEQFV